MFGREAVHELQTLLHGRRHAEEDAVAVEDALDEGLARQRFRLREHLPPYFLGERRVRRHEERLLPARTVLGLAEEVGGDPLRGNRAVREDGDLARTRHLVDADVAVHLALRGRHERIARPDDLLHLPHRLRAERHEADRLDAAHAVDLRRAREPQGVEEDGVRRTRGPGGRAGDDLLHAGRLREGDGHDARGGKRRRAARHVHAHAVHRRVELARRAAPRRLHRPGGLQRRLREAHHARVGVLHGAPERGRHLRLRRRKLVLRHAETLRRELRPLELRDIPRDGPVPLRANRRQHLRRSLLGLLGERAAREELRDILALRLLGRPFDNAHHADFLLKSSTYSTSFPLVNQIGVDGGKGEGEEDRTRGLRVVSFVPNKSSGAPVLDNGGAIA